MRRDSLKYRTARDANRSNFATASAATSPKHLSALVWLVICGLTTGCAALTNPTTHGVPVRILPEEILAKTKEGFQPIPLTLLRQPPPDRYLLEPGDTLGIYIEGILGTEETPPPVNIPESSTEEPPSIGYPFPIRQDGTIALPYVGSVAIAKPALEEGITIEEAEEKVVDAYREKEILRVEDKRILVSLFRPRHVRVMVMRDDSGGPSVSLQSTSPLGLGSSRATIGGGRSSIGQILELPAYQNDVLNALARTGGIPNVETTKEIVIQRGFWDAFSDPMAENCLYPTAADVGRKSQSQSPGCRQPSNREQPQGFETGSKNPERRLTSIPLRIRCGEPVPFGPKDIVLKNGDIVIVRSRRPEFYYTGGLIQASENPLPLDYDISVVEALLRSRAPLLNGGLNTSNLNGSVLGAGAGNPSPSLLSLIRKTPMGGQVTIRIDLNEAMRDPRENILVQAEDVLILQEMPNEAITRYFTQVFQFNFFGRFLNRADLQGSGSLTIP